MSIATNILVAIKDKIDLDKKIISEVYTDYTTLQELEDIAKTDDSELPAAFIYIQLEETNAGAVLNRTLRNTRLPVSIDIFGTRHDNILLEQEEALKDVRDIVELPANATWSQPDSVCVITQEINKVIRMTPWVHTSEPDIVIWSCSVQFDIWYTHTLGIA